MAVLSPHSAGTMTAQSMWVSCNQYKSVLDCLYSVDSLSIYILTRNKHGYEEMHSGGKKQII